MKRSPLLRLVGGVGSGRGSDGAGIRGQLVLLKRISLLMKAGDGKQWNPRKEGERKREKNLPCYA